MADAFDSMFQQSVGSAFPAGSIAAAVLRLVLVLYAGMAAPSLPPAAMNLFENPLFRVAILMLVVWIGGTDPSTSLLIAVGFMVSMNTLSGKQMLERFGESQMMAEDEDPMM